MKLENFFKFNRLYDEIHQLRSLQKSLKDLKSKHAIFTWSVNQLLRDIEIYKSELNLNNISVVNLQVRRTPTECIVLIDDCEIAPIDILHLDYILSKHSVKTELEKMGMVGTPKELFSIIGAQLFLMSEFRENLCKIVGERECDILYSIHKIANLTDNMSVKIRSLIYSWMKK